MNFLSFGKTKSGLPGRSATCDRSLWPNDRAIFLTASSGLVFFAWMSAIRLLRSVGVSVSIDQGPPNVNLRHRRPPTVSHGPRCGKDTMPQHTAQGNYSLFHRLWMKPVLSRIALPTTDNKMGSPNFWAAHFFRSSCKLLASPFRLPRVRRHPCAGSRARRLLPRRDLPVA